MAVEHGKVAGLFGKKRSKGGVPSVFYEVTFEDGQLDIALVDADGNTQRHLLSIKPTGITRYVCCEGFGIAVDADGGRIKVAV